MISKRGKLARSRTSPLGSKPVVMLYLAENIIRPRQASPTSTEIFCTPNKMLAQSTKALMLQAGQVAARLDHRLVPSKQQTSSANRLLIRPNHESLPSTRARSECQTVQRLRGLFGTTQGLEATRCGQILSEVNLLMLKEPIKFSKDCSPIKALKTNKMSTTHERREGSGSIISPFH